MLDKVLIIFDGDNEIVGVYENPKTAMNKMIELYRDYLNNHLDYYAKDKNVEDILYDLDTLQRGYIEEICYLEEHSVIRDADK